MPFWLVYMETYRIDFLRPSFMIYIIDHHHYLYYYHHYYHNHHYFYYFHHYHHHNIYPNHHHHHSHNQHYYYYYHHHHDLDLSQEDIKDIAADLLECWGIGPIKVTINTYMHISMHK
jgi:hypothetical protein